MTALENAARIASIQAEIKGIESRISGLRASEIAWRNDSNIGCSYSNNKKQADCVADRAYKKGVADQRAFDITNEQNKIKRLTDELNQLLDSQRAESKVAVNLSEKGTSYQATLIEAQAKANATTQVANAQVTEITKSSEGKKIMYVAIGLGIIILIGVAVKIIKSKFA